MRAATLLVTTAGAIGYLLTGPAAYAQSEGESGLSTPVTPQAPITPAPTQVPQGAELPSPFPQTTPNVPTGSTRSSARMTEGLGSPVGGSGLGFGPIRPGDIAEVQIFESPEFSTRMPVSPAGDIAIPLLGVFHIAGMTSIEAAGAIAQQFSDRNLLRQPHVIVTVQQFGFGVTVLGEVRAPGVYQLTGQKRLVDVLTEAGGLTDRAGHLIHISDKGSMKGAQTVLWDPALRENDNADLQLKPGQTVLVSRCGVVYVGGNVNRPGAFPLCDSAHTTLSEVIALAQGTKPSSYSQRTLLLRTTGNQTRIAENIKLDDVLRGKRTDITLQGDDIIFVPPSALKAAAKTMLQSGVGFATQAYLYLR